MSRPVIDATAGLDPLDATFEALVIWGPVSATHEGVVRAALLTRLRALDAAGVHIFLLGAGPEERDALDRVRVGPGQIHAISGTDRRRAARRAAAWLARRGVTGNLVLAIGRPARRRAGAPTDWAWAEDELPGAVMVSVAPEDASAPGSVIRLGGGPPRLLELLDGQVRRRHQRRVPQVDWDPRWILPLPSASSERRVAESLGSLSNGAIGVRGALEEDGPGSDPLVLVNGAYDDGASLLAGPVWTGLERLGDPGAAIRRYVDLRTGVLVRQGDGVRSLRFVSAMRPELLAMRAEAPAGELRPGPPLRPPSVPVGYAAQQTRGRSVARTRSGRSEIVVAALNRLHTHDRGEGLERLAAWTVDGGDAPEALERAVAAGFDVALAEHRREWARRWASAAVTIEGDPGAELAARLAIFHLLSAAPDSGEAAVGPRGLTGEGYGGHVFWDADVFVLPALAAIRPAAARSMLEYRVRRLPQARAAAVARGRRGARFPWESAADGTDVTPHKVRAPDATVIPIATGEHEEHIVADVAWAADRYRRWTGDDAFGEEGGDELITDTARYWSSRIRLDLRGGAHIYGVMGPDEYHPAVDDNAYTNVMARWNLRAGADVLDRRDEAGEAAHWRSLADRLVDGWRPRRQLYEQFAGYFELEPLLIASLARRPVSADALLGVERVEASQILKQADVLMLHHLVPGEVVAKSLGPCLAFYEPRTAHGELVVPAVHASLLARAGEPERALELFEMAARLDLDDLTGTTASGLHLATMGGLWQALAQGFLGLALDGHTVSVDPKLPARWSCVELDARVRGGHVHVRASHDHVRVDGDDGLQVRLPGRQPRRLGRGGMEVRLERRP